MFLALAPGFVTGKGEPAPAPRSLAYVLQADRLARSRAECVEKLRSCDRDWIVLDAMFETGQAWTKEEIAAIRAGKPGRRVVAYVSIGEAEDYRRYWRREWDADRDGRPDAGAPSFLLAENPDWKGNYRVRFWQAEWQKLALPMVDQVLVSGFDGIYLDIVDAFEFFEYDPAAKEWRDHARNPETGRTYRQDMAAWVGTIARRARAQRRDFLVIPQNAPQLLEDAGYRRLISAIGVEDLLVKGSRLSTDKETLHTLGFLKKLSDEGKPVLLIDYPASRKIEAAAFERAAALGYVLLLTDRELASLGKSGR